MIAIAYEIALAIAWLGLAAFFIFISNQLKGSEWFNKLFFSLAMTCSYGLMFSLSIMANSAALIADIGSGPAGTLQKTLEAAGIASMLVTGFFWFIFLLEIATRIFDKMSNPYSNVKTTEIQANMR